MNATSIDEKIANENALSGTLKSLFAVAEAYPQLQANTNFMDLQQQLKMLEDEIANSRKYYNAVVRTMNTKVESFPAIWWPVCSDSKNNPSLKLVLPKNGKMFRLNLTSPLKLIGNNEN